MAISRTVPMKWERTSTGGDEESEYPSPALRNNDALDVRGTFFQDDSSNDENVLLERASNKLTLKDAGESSGSELITSKKHKALRHLVHFIDDGPAEGFSSGAYKETTGAPFPSSEIWYTSSGKTAKIVELTITRNANQTPSQEVWKVYDTDGTTVLATVTDAITYAGDGITEASRTRTIA